ncbi:MAG: gamma-glutamylcyclotransferase [Acidimicrobiia bacterium]
MISHLFVYGTLRPGDVRWPLLEPWVVDVGVDDTVPGLLFDTGLGYPAAVFGDEGTIVGRTYALRAGTIDEALHRIDDEEDTVLGLYRRVEVLTGRGRRAWAYQYGTGLELTPIPSGDWFQYVPGTN